MDPVTPLIGIAVLIAAATALGLLLRRRGGRAKAVADTAAIDPAILGAKRFGAAGTVVQFSTEFCSRCPSVKRLLVGQVAERPGVDFLHVDLTHAPSLAKQFHVLQTPTVVFIDADGRPRTRISGRISPEQVRESINELAGLAPARPRTGAAA